MSLLSGSLNIGRLPTFGGTGLRIEVFILDFDRDIYDQPIRVFFRAFIREDRQFESAGALIERMHIDVQEVREALSGGPR